MLDSWRLLHTDPTMAAQRDFVTALNEKYRPYADANFEVELRLRFGSRFWEMYLACAMLDLGFDLKTREDRPKAGPDLCIQSKDRNVWIEAIAPLAGTGADAVPELDDDGGWTPEEQIVLRYRTALEAKWNSRRNYIASGITRADEPFVVALNGFQVPGDNCAYNDEIPYPVQSVLPLGRPTIIIQNGKVVRYGFETRWSIQKRSGALVRTEAFLTPEYSCISGILFSGTNPLHTHAINTKQFAFLHNPKAEAPLPHGWLGAGMEYWVEGNGLLWKRIP